jgi:hypothetical protein
MAKPRQPFGRMSNLYSITTNQRSHPRALPRDQPLCRQPAAHAGRVSDFGGAQHRHRSRVVASAHIPAITTSAFAFDACSFPAIFLNRSCPCFAVPSLDCPPTACPSVDGSLIGLLSGIVFGGLFAHRAFLRLCMIEVPTGAAVPARPERNDHRRLLIIVCSVGVCGWVIELGAFDWAE